MGRSITRLGAGCAGILVGLALAAAPALADSSTLPSFKSGGPLSMPTRTAAATSAVVQSAYFGGYDVVPSEGISSAGSTFKLPKFSCPAAGVLQLDGFGEWINNATGDLYQDGGDTDAYAVGSIVCNYGVPGYEINASTAGGKEADQTVDVNQGDLIQTRVEELPSGDALATVTDLTTGQQVSSEGPSTGDESQIYEGIVPDVYNELFQDSLTIPKFKTVAFSRSQVGGLHLSQLNPTATALDQDGPVMVKPSAIVAGHLGAFTLTEKNDH
jgi:Peptidase A4 family